MGQLHVEAEGLGEGFVEIELDDLKVYPADDGEGEAQVGLGCHAISITSLRRACDLGADQDARPSGARWPIAARGCLAGS
ncbi:hypothetical protein AB4141_40400, partial [Cupriavidus sp. 2KB_15]|uniref:hypothetical protein n=1 Tax=Cupriavidus sp. 2KB_15 TaxID=3232976 RepID=UPI003F8F9B6B